MKRTAVWVGAVLAAGGLLAGLASGWWVKGHGTIAEAAAARLPDDVPTFFRAGGKHLAYFAGEPEKVGITAEEVCRGLEAKRVENVWEHVNRFIAESHAPIPACYELDAKGAFDTPTPESRAFVLARCRAGAQLTLDLWYTAWLRSDTLPAPY